MEKPTEFYESTIVLGAAELYIKGNVNGAEIHISGHYDTRVGEYTDFHIQRRKEEKIIKILRQEGLLGRFEISPENKRGSSRKKQLESEKEFNYTKYLWLSFGDNETWDLNRKFQDELPNELKEFIDSRPGGIGYFDHGLEIMVTDNVELYVRR